MNKDLSLQEQMKRWNDTTIGYSKGKCIHQLFEEQVENTPEAVAIVFKDKHITYGELNV